MNKKLLLKGCVIITLLPVAAFLFLLWAMFSDQSTYVSNASSHKFAPPEAKSIEYYENHNISGFVSVKYSISESDFRKFAEAQGWTLKTVEDGAGVSIPSEYAIGSHGKIKIGSCLFFQDRKSNGCGITVAYDLSKSIAYINKSNR